MKKVTPTHTLSTTLLTTLLFAMCAFACCKKPSTTTPACSNPPCALGKNTTSLNFNGAAFSWTGGQPSTSIGVCKQGSWYYPGGLTGEGLRFQFCINNLPMHINVTSFVQLKVGTYIINRDFEIRNDGVDFDGDSDSSSIGSLIITNSNDFAIAGKLDFHISATSWSPAIDIKNLIFDIKK